LVILFLSWKLVWEGLVFLASRRNILFRSCVMGRGPTQFSLSSPSHLYSLSLAYSTPATSLPSHHNSHKYQTLYIIPMKVFYEGRGQFYP
jgi:hypothetical protein